jgi:hypothetical protein
VESVESVEWRITSHLPYSPIAGFLGFPDSHSPIPRFPDCTDSTDSRIIESSNSRIPELPIPNLQSQDVHRVPADHGIAPEQDDGRAHSQEDPKGDQLAGLEADGSEDNGTDE